MEPRVSPVSSQCHYEKRQILFSLDRWKTKVLLQIHHEVGQSETKWTNRQRNGAWRQAESLPFYQDAICVTILFWTIVDCLHWRTGQAVSADKVFLAVMWPPPSTRCTDNSCFSAIPLNNCLGDLADPCVKYLENSSSCGWQYLGIPPMVGSQVLISFSVFASFRDFYAQLLLKIYKYFFCRPTNMSYRLEKWTFQMDGT